MHVHHACIQLAFQGLSQAFDPLRSLTVMSGYMIKRHPKIKVPQADLLAQDQVDMYLNILINDQVL